MDETTQQLIERALGLYERSLDLYEQRLQFEMRRDVRIAAAAETRAVAKAKEKVLRPVVKLSTRPRPAKGFNP